ncbi:hypothetical protein [Mycoplasma simbae]|uniref:hypothetical protein n=1 Tax=Mycoplasma simbae TaxID=36744 RepID=UPI0004972C84|nr:hypothetical protein [Mycoplasma simbae]
MKIKFHSIADQEENNNVVEFEAEASYEITHFKDIFDNDKQHFHTFTFTDPQNKQPVRIEINDSRVNILNNHATLELRHKKFHSGSHVNANGNKFNLKTFMNACQVEDTKYYFEYEIFSVNNDPMGKFKITITKIDE